MKLKSVSLGIMAVLTLAPSSASHAHEGHHHGGHSTQAKASDAKPDLLSAYGLIQTDYAKNIKPIFDQKCAACHSLESPAPWYAAVPLAGWLVQSDRSEAKEHLEISKGFPFAGHGTPEEDLTAIKEEVEKGEMPTFLYRMVHPSSRLTPQEKQAVISWVNSSQNRIIKTTR